MKSLDNTNSSIKKVIFKKIYPVKYRRIYGILREGINISLLIFLIFQITIGVFLLPNPRNVEAGNFTFTQTSWATGATANKANHTSNQTGWAEYSATSTASFTAGTELALQSGFVVGGSTYSYRQKISIAAQTHISGDLTDFPTAINIASSNTNFWAHEDGVGSYVRFTSPDGTTPLKFQVESYDAVGDDAWYHVKVPTLSSSAATDIYIYYGSANPSAGDDAPGTWDANFVAVHHLNQDQAEGAYDDATSNYPATNLASTDITGRIDKARHFAGATLDLSLGVVSELTGVSNFTIEYTVKEMHQISL